MRAEREEYLRTIGVRRVLDHCTTLRSVGCALAWCVGNAVDISAIQGNRSFQSGIFSSGVWHKAVRQRAALPIGEGEFSGLLAVSRSISLEDTADETHQKRWAKISWQMVSCFACNSLMGESCPFRPGKWTGVEKKLAIAVAQSVERFASHGQELDVDVKEVEKDLNSKRVGYSGEEIGVCTTLTLKQVIPALPPAEHGGVIDILPLVSPITRDLLLHPERLRVTDVGQDMPKLKGKIHVRPEEVDDLADELIERGICRWLPWEEVAEFRGEKVLNGLFGVPKNTTLADGSPVLRLIMNLVPGNAITRQIKGAIRNLPHITAWLSTYVEQGEYLRIWQSDMSNAFYLFKIPDAWSPYLSFNIARQMGEDEFGKPLVSVLACRVLPMGWASSVGIMQEVSEAILHLGNLRKEDQLRRQSPLPPWMVGLISEAHDKGKAWWHVYLDNFAAGEIVDGTNRDGGDHLHQLAEDAWRSNGVISSAKKKKKAVSLAQELGAEINGEVNTLGASPERLLRLVQATFLLLSRRHLPKRLVQIVVGRWVHVFQFRRPAMSFLDAVWEYTSSKRFDQNLMWQVRRELFLCVCAIPMLHTNLGAGIADIITASDASQTGGAVGIAKELATEGKSFVRHSLNGSVGVRVNVIVISLFNGIGGAFRCYDILGVIPLLLVAFDLHGPAMRITSRRWPHALLYGDVRSLNAGLVEAWLAEYPEVEEIHLWAGFPCTDLSSVNAMGKGLEGPQSSLFFEIPRIQGLLREVVPSYVKIKSAVENVASMTKEECQRISKVLKMKPYHLNPADAVPMQRPRLCWCSEKVEGAVEDLTFRYEDFWTEIEARASYPRMEQWMTPGVVWEGGEQGYTLPTALKSIKRSRPPPRPAGIQRCDPDTLARWESDSYRFPPYHYLDRFIFWQGPKWRLANSSEKELLLGYGSGHTELCFSASKIKQSKVAYEDERLSLLGDSFSIYSFCIIAAALCKKFISRVSYGHLASRMGIAPGVVIPIHHTCRVQRSLAYGDFVELQHFTPKELNKVLLSRTNHTGSDVRISTGEILNPKAAVRQSIQASWWNWQHSFAVKWKQRDHINLLELRSILLSIKFHVSHLKHSGLRIFHLTDSYICMSVISKGRSGSRQLGRILKQLNAHLLGFSLQLIIAHVESSENPTDGASRHMEVQQSQNSL